MLDHKLSNLKKLPEFQIQKQWHMTSKHNLLAEIVDRQASGTVKILSTRERVKLMTLKLTRKFMPTIPQMVALVLLFSVGASTTYMAQASVPGDALWGVKLTLEKAQVALAMDSAYEGQLHLRHADNRLKELSIIVGKPSSQARSNNISQLVRRLEKDMTAAGQSLKITKEERQNTEPQLIMTLAKDLNDKASEVIKVLEENKLVLASAAESEMQAALSGTATSSDQFTANMPLATGTPPEGVVTISESQASANAVSAVITEVQNVNREVSGSALVAMIDLIERGRASNRAEVTSIVNAKIAEEKKSLEKLQNQIPFVNDDFQLHRVELRSQARKIETTLRQAGDLANLDNLSGAFKKLDEGGTLMSSAESILSEVVNGGGLLKEKEAPAVPKAKEIPVPITIQTIPSATDTVATMSVEDGKSPK